MKILRIEAGLQEIRFYTDADGAVIIRESVPTVGNKPGRTLSFARAKSVGGVISLPRHENANDRLYSRYALFTPEGRAIGGAAFVTRIDANVPSEPRTYIPRPTIQALAAPPMLAKKLGLAQSLVNVNLPNLMTLLPGRDDIAHEFNGRSYYFRREAVEALDEKMRAATLNTLILLNSPRLFGSTGEGLLLDACIHPHYDWNCSNAYISAFDMETEEGQNIYGAFVDFLAGRYTRPDGRYGRAVGAIVSNEVNSQYVWGNAGEMPVEEYVREYAQALRLTWLCGRRHCAYWRTYISLDQFWCSSNFSAAPLRFYGSRKVLECLNEDVCAEGNFDWDVAHHPYPEDLRCPDFWNDRAADFSFSTPKITFKNMEVLAAFLSQPAFLIDGRARHIIFSEQGFNSQKGPLQGYTERQAAAGYMLAYLKARKMPTVDLFTHHACIDNPKEFGLNLGLFRYAPDAPEHVGEPKPIFASFAAIGTPDEADAVRAAREFIGPELFDYLLDPPLILGERDISEDDVFGG